MSLISPSLKQHPSSEPNMLILKDKDYKNRMVVKNHTAINKSNNAMKSYPGNGFKAHFSTDLDIMTPKKPQ